MTQIRTEEIADGIFQFATYIADIDFGLNQYLVVGDEPLLFHTGMRSQFSELAEAVSLITPIECLRWISFGHVEADECGALNQWLHAAPSAVPTTGTIGCMVSISDMADRAPRALDDSEIVDTGGHRLRWIETPHLPHGWEAGLLFDETTNTLLCGDLFSRWGDYPASTTDSIVVADEADDPSYSLAPSSPAQLRNLAALGIDTLAPMHGPAQSGAGSDSLLTLAGLIEAKLARGDTATT